MKVRAGPMSMRGKLIHGDAKDVLMGLSSASVSACITDPPYNYEFIGHKWNNEEIERRMQRASAPDS